MARTPTHLHARRSEESNLNRRDVAPLALGRDPGRRQDLIDETTEMRLPMPEKIRNGG
jgi:hypothetical protein